MIRHLVLDHPDQFLDLRGTGSFPVYYKIGMHFRYFCISNREAFEPGPLNKTGREVTLGIAKNRTRICTLDWLRCASFFKQAAYYCAAIEIVPAAIQRHYC